MRNLDSLLDESEPAACFHDARLTELRINFGSASLEADCSLCVSEAGEPERHRQGRLSVSQLRHFSMDDDWDRSEPLSPLWLTADGHLSDCPSEPGRRLAASLGDYPVALFLFFSDVNAFAYLAAESAEFAWLE